MISSNSVGYPSSGLAEMLHRPVCGMAPDMRQLTPRSLRMRAGRAASSPSLRCSFFTKSAPDPTSPVGGSPTRGAAGDAVGALREQAPHLVLRDALHELDAVGGGEPQLEQCQPGPLRPDHAGHLPGGRKSRPQGSRTQRRSAAFCGSSSATSTGAAFGLPRVGSGSLPGTGDAAASSVVGSVNVIRVPRSPPAKTRRATLGVRRQASTASNFSPGPHRPR